MSVPRSSFADVNARRLQRHGVTAPFEDGDPATVARAICGAHSQVAHAGEVSLALRYAGGTRSDVQRALDGQRLVRTHGPRGTVHVLAADDLATWCGALGAIPTGPDGLARDLRYTPDQRDTLLAAIGDALTDAALTTDELTDVLVDAVGPWAREPTTDAFQQRTPRWRQLTHTAAFRGVLCYGPNRGRRVTFTNPARWWPGFAPAEADAAVATVVTRYLHAYGPATPQQFARWLAAPITWATDRFTRLGERIRPVEVDGQPAWSNVDDLDAPEPPPPPAVRLLPFFDAFGVGSYPREALFPGRVAERALAGGQAGNFPLLLLDGLVAGVWHQRRTGRRLRVTVEPLARLRATQRRALEAEAARIAAIQDAELELTVGTISVGAHA